MQVDVVDNVNIKYFLGRLKNTLKQIKFYIWSIMQVSIALFINKKKINNFLIKIFMIHLLPLFKGKS